MQEHVAPAWRDAQASAVTPHRDDKPGWEAAEVDDQIARIEDELAAFEAECAADEQREREAEARDNAFYKKLRVVEIIIGLGLLGIAFAYGQ